MKPYSSERPRPGSTPPSVLATLLGSAGPSTGRLPGLFLALCVTVVGTGIKAATPSRAVAQEDPFSLAGLVVTASPTAAERDAVASHVTILSGLRLRDLGVRPLGDALRDVPGISVVQSGSFGSVTSVFLRGGESDYTLVLVDGVQVNQAGGGFDFASLTTDNVERVEIVRGPASALYGSDAVAGVINVITRTGRGSPSGSMAFEGGSFGRQDWAGDFQAGTDRAGWSVSLARRHTDGILAFNNGSTNTVLTGNARLRPDDATMVAVTLHVSDREYHYPTDGSGATVDRNAFTFSDITTARVTARRDLSDIFGLEALLSLNESDGGTDDAPDSAADSLGFYGFTSLDDFRRASGELRGHVTLEHARLTGGFEYEQERQRSFSETLSEFGPSSGRSESERDNRAWFVHAAADVSTLSLSAGTRFDDNERFGGSLTWQAGATWRPAVSTGTLLRASAGTAIKEPTFFENFATGFAIGNPDLDPERSWSWEVGVEQGLVDGRLTLGATYFDQTFENLIQYTFAPPNPGDPNYFNIAEAASRGVEVDLAARGDVFNGGLSWTWLDTEVLDAGFDEGDGATFVNGEALIRRPSHSASVRAGATLSRMSVTAIATVVGERADRDFGAFPAVPVTLASYTLLSAGGSWRLVAATGSRPGFSLEIRGENLLDASYQEAFGFTAPGRGLYIGGRLVFGGS